jgi:hypothetical protein
MLTYSVWAGNYALIIPKQLRDLFVAAANPATTSVTPVCIYADLIPRSRRTCRSADAEVAGALNV